MITIKVMTLKRKLVRIETLKYVTTYIFTAERIETLKLGSSYRIILKTVVVFLSNCKNISVYNLIFIYYIVYVIGTL